MTFHLTLRHDNLLQLVMGAADLKDEKIKLCVQLIDDEVLNINVQKGVSRRPPRRD